MLASTVAPFQTLCNLKRNLYCTKIFNQSNLASHIGRQLNVLEWKVVSHFPALEEVQGYAIAGIPVCSKSSGLERLIILHAAL
jgi:hypothetical protein